MRVEKYNFVDIVVVIFLVMTSGYLGIGSINPITIPLFFISTCLFFLKHVKLGKGSVILLIVFMFLLFLQKYRWGGSLGNILNIELQLISYAFLASCIESSFSKLFPKIVCVIAAISLFFYIVDHIGGHGILLSIAQNFPINLENQNDTMDGYSFLLYVVDAGGGLRNCGPFFEPGRYIVVLLIAFAINLINKNTLINLENGILLVSILTTISLSGIATLFVVLAVYFLKKEKKNSWVVVVLFILAILVLYPTLSQSDYFGGKLADNYENMDDSNSRFGAMIYLWSQVLESPFVGYGPAIYVFDEFEVNGISSPNGWGELMRYWGIPMAVFCFFMLYRSAKTMQIESGGGCLIFLLASAMVAFPQSVMTCPLYYVLFFLGCKSFGSFHKSPKKVQTIINPNSNNNM